MKYSYYQSDKLILCWYFYLIKTRAFLVCLVCVNNEPLQCSLCSYFTTDCVYNKLCLQLIVVVNELVVECCRSCFCVQCLRSTLDCWVRFHQTTAGYWYCEASLASALVEFHSRKCLVPPPKNCDVAQRNFCATFAFLCKRAIFATERNFRAILAHFGLFFGGFLPFWKHFGAKNRKWNLWAPTIFPTFVAVCLKIATSWLPTFFHCQCHWTSVARLTTLCVACCIGYHFCEQRLLPKIGLHLTFALH